MKKILLLVVTAMLATMTVQAQQLEERIGCIHNSVTTRAETMHILLEPYTFDPQKTYRVPVILISYELLHFLKDDPATYYNRLFNEHGFNEGAGKGCVADYFREQSRGRANFQFDIYGPVEINEQPKKSGINYGSAAIRKALASLRETETTDFSIYDWDGDGDVNHVLFLFAGYSGNKVTGYIWPNTGRFFGQMPGGISASYASSTCERWEDDSLCGIGTIIHEFCHSLGLPDIYPLAPATGSSTVDEWDVMDGGNYTNKGWCPPNLTAMELMYLGWSTPVELQRPVTIQNMKPLSQGGETYIIRSNSNGDEYYFLENRRQEGWDYGIPGNGLLIYHVDFDKDEWMDNHVNIDNDHFRYDLFHADGKNYNAWELTINDLGDSRWTMDNHLRSSYLSTSAYPYTNPLTHEVNARLTDDSSPAAILFAGQRFMGKPITDIRLAPDGTISFNFMTDGSGIEATDGGQRSGNGKACYDLLGREVKGDNINGGYLPRGVYIREGYKVIVK